MRIGLTEKSSIVNVVSRRLSVDDSCSGLKEKENKLSLEIGFRLILAYSQMIVKRFIHATRFVSGTLDSGSYNYFYFEYNLNFPSV